MAAFFWAFMQGFQSVAMVGIFVSSLAWLVPNHYMPWLGAWNEAVSITGLLLMLLAIVVDRVHRPALSRTLIAVIGLSSSVIVIQFLTGKLHFAGDALLALLYVGLWGGALLAGRYISSHVEAPKLLAILATSWGIAAFVSVVIALNQWTGAVNLQIYSADLPIGGRPFANLAQPNHFCSLCFIGLCGLLLLFEKRLLGALSASLMASVLIVGMVSSQSRTGWLQISLLLFCILVARRQGVFHANWLAVGALGAIYALLVLTWNSICSFLMLPIGRLSTEQIQPGVRIPYWREMIDAIGHHPFSGYGWLQTGLAQQQVAVDHQPIGALFDYSHNLVLDLILWMGLPVSVVIVSLLTWWLVGRIRASKNSSAVIMLITISGMLAHAMLEYPLAYAYFLIPFGLAMGVVDALAPNDRKPFVIIRPVAIAFVGLLAIAFALVGNDYLKIEERFRNLRFEMKKIGIDRAKPQETHAKVLTQLEALMTFYKTEARPNMEPEQLDLMRNVSERYGYPPVLLRYALASGLNFEPAVAEITLARLCSIHLSARCDEAKESWSELTVRYPQLSEVRFPESPWIKQGFK